MDVKALERKMKELKVTNADIAKYLGIDESTWYRKKASSQLVKLNDVKAISQLLKLTDAEERAIFFN